MRPAGYTLPRPAFNRPGSEVLIRLGVSLILSILLWGWVTNVQDPERVQTFAGIDVSLDPPDAGLEIVTDVAPVEVELTAPSSVLDDITRSDLDPVIDLSEITEPGTYRARIVVTVPEAVRTVDLTPREVSVVVQATTTRTLPISFLLPDLNEGTRQLGQLQPDATEVQLTGSRTLIDSIDRIVVPIEVGDRTSTFSDDFRVVALNGEGVEVRDISVNPGSVRVRVPISTRGRTVPVLVTVEGQPAMGFEEVSRTTDPRMVVIDGPPEVLAGIGFVSTQPVDISGRTGTVQQSVEVTGIPAEVRVLEPGSGTIDAIVQISPRGQRRVLTDQPVRVIGVDPGTMVTVSPAVVDVELLAADQALGPLLDEEVSVVVDVTGLPPDTYDLAPILLLPPNVEWISTDPATVTVTITPGTAPGAPIPSPEPLPDPPR